MWVYKENDFMISTILCYIFEIITETVLKLQYVKDHFPKMF